MPGVVDDEQEVGHAPAIHPAGPECRKRENRALSQWKVITLRFLFFFFFIVVRRGIFQFIVCFMSHRGRGRAAEGRGSRLESLKRTACTRPRHNSDGSVPREGSIQCWRWSVYNGGRVWLLQACTRRPSGGDPSIHFLECKLSGSGTVNSR